VKIKGFNVSNLLSFSERGLTQNGKPIELGEFNLFIGKNNSGKSNILKILDFIKIILASIERGKAQAPQDYALLIKKDEMNFQDWFYSQDLTKRVSFQFELEIEEEDQLSTDRPDDPVFFQLNLKRTWPKLIRFTGRVEAKKTGYVFRISKVEIPCDHREYPVLFDESQNVIMHLSKDLRIYTVSQVPPETFQKYYSPIGLSLIPFLQSVWDSIFKELIIKISAVRQIVGTEANPGDPKYWSDTGVVRTLDSLRDGRLEERDRFRSIKEFLTKLIYPDCPIEKIEIIFPVKQRNDRYSRELEIDLAGQILPLSHFGSGVEQLLAMATEVVRYGPGKIVLIEEPEAHFHPDLQRKFIKFLKENNPGLKHQYLIATHSNIFINEFLNMGANTFYVNQEEEKDTGKKYSRVAELGSSNLPNLLRDLNVKGSDLLQTNGIIWVEGPSDKIYVQKWIDLYYKEHRKEETPWVEGRHYQIVCYGGSLLKYLTIDPAEDFWRQDNLDNINAMANLLKTNRNSVILMDRDDMDNPLPTSKWKADKKKEIEKICQEHGIMAWITHSKDIEDYLPARFEKKVRSHKYENSKVKGASEIVDQLQPSDLNVHDLEEKIGELVKRVEEWNC
jgi:energy-coupling factor transporter ATP-binding protein EcfA2